VTPPLANCPAPGSLASRLPRLPRSRRRPHSRDRRPLLAVWALAKLRLGQLAAASAPQLSAVPGTAVLVALPEKYRLRSLRAANASPLTSVRNHPKNGPKASKTHPWKQENAPPMPKKG
jgi:hypothetical protein